MMIPRLTPENSLLLIVDIQDKLLTAIPKAKSIISNTVFLQDVALLLNVPMIATEQYPKGLGPTTSEIARRLTLPIPAKTSFSCGMVESIVSQIKQLNRLNIVIVGMESHVCVLQTALDLIQTGLTIFLAVDAVGSRFEIDEQIALQRLLLCNQQSKINSVLTTVESVAFEWMRDAAHPQFKSLSKLVIERSKVQ